MSAQDPGTTPMGPGTYMTPDPTGPQLSPIQWGMLWALLYVVPDAANAPIRAAIEDYFEAKGLDLSVMRGMAEASKAMAEQSLPDTE